MVNVLYILDEPTTHLDIAAREGLQEAILQYNGTVCLVSHDIEFVRKSATTIVAMDGQMGIKKYFGDYDYFREKIGGEESADSQNTRIKTIKQNENQENPKKKPSRNDKRNHINRLEKKISKLEAEIDTWVIEKDRLTKEVEANAPGIDFSAIGIQLRDLDDKIDTASEKWNSFAEELEKKQC